VEQQAMSENKNNISKSAKRDAKIKTLSNKCLRETFVDLDDQEKCHILDPETGLNLTDRVKQDKTHMIRILEHPNLERSGVTSSGRCIKGPLMKMEQLLWILLMMQ